MEINMMTSKNTRATVAAFIAALALIVAATTAGAQVRGPLSITNNTSCTVGVCDDNGTVCFAAPPGNSTINIPCNTTAIGIRSCTGLRVIPLGQCLNGVGVGNACCTTICFVPGIVGCTFFLTINPSPTPCLCPHD
jgi:hypothetical protein